jgi:hypothetical protein
MLTFLVEDKLVDEPGFEPELGSNDKELKNKNNKKHFKNSQW